MKNTLFKNRGFFLILVLGTVILFVGLVWLIATMVPLKWLGQADPSMTAVISRTENNCTYPVAYWKEHPEMFPSQVVLGDNVYYTDEMEEALSGEDQDFQTALKAQLFGTFLNILAGADQGLISGTVFQAYEWLIQHPGGSSLSDGEAETGARLTSVLLAYNLGQAGVAQCSNVVISATTRPTMLPSLTATIMPSHTPSQTGTSSPSATASPTSTQIVPIFTVVVPSQTRTPTREPTNEPPAPTNTQAPPPEATNTPVPPTDEPAATRTLPPPQTTPTLPPPPP